MRSLYGLFLGLLLLALIACSEQSGTDAAPTISAFTETISVQSNENGYPAPSSLSAYPGASDNSSIEMVTRTPSPTVDLNLPIPTPEAGKATITGYILSAETGGPLVDVPVSLAEIYRNAENQGAFVYDTAFSPLAFTDGNGRFILSSIDAKEYVMVVGSVEVNRYEIMTDEDGAGQIFVLVADTVTDVGELRVGFEW
jgi:hypothetical protein